MKDPIDIRLYHGGKFVTRSGKTTYEKGESSKYGLTLHPNVQEVCYFEFVGWIKGELGYKNEGTIWYREHGKTLYTGRKQLVSDDDIPDFLFSREADGWYHLYVIHEPEKEVFQSLKFGPGVTFYTD